MQLHLISSVIKVQFRVGKGVPKAILRFADLVNECISYVQFLVEGKVSTQDKDMV